MGLLIGWIAGDVVLFCFTCFFFCAAARRASLRFSLRSRLRRSAESSESDEESVPLDDDEGSSLELSLCLGFLVFFTFFVFLVALEFFGFLVEYHFLSAYLARMNCSSWYVSVSIVGFRCRSSLRSYTAFTASLPPCFLNLSSSL